LLLKLFILLLIVAPPILLVVLSTVLVRKRKGLGWLWLIALLYFFSLFLVCNCRDEILGPETFHVSGGYDSSATQPPEVEVESIDFDSITEEIVEGMGDLDSLLEDYSPADHYLVDMNQKELEGTTRYSFYIALDYDLGQSEEKKEKLRKLCEDFIGYIRGGLQENNILNVYVYADENEYNADPDNFLVKARMSGPLGRISYEYAEAVGE